MLLMNDAAEQLRQRVQATLNDVSEASNLAPLFTALEQACFAPWLAAGLVVSSERVFKHQSRELFDLITIDVQQSAILTLPTGEPALQAIFLLMMAAHANGSVSVQVDLLAEEYTCNQPGCRVDMQVAKVWSKIDENGTSCLPQLQPALLQNFESRLKGKGESGRIFSPLLQHVSTASLDWLTP